VYDSFFWNSKIVAKSTLKMNQYVAGYLWDGMYWYLFNNVGVFHLNYVVLKYVSAAITTISPTYLDTKYLHRAYDWPLVWKKIADVLNLIRTGYKMVLLRCVSLLYRKSVEIFCEIYNCYRCLYFVILCLCSCISWGRFIQVSFIVTNYFYFSYTHIDTIRQCFLHCLLSYASIPRND